MCSVGDDNYDGEDASKYLPSIDKLNLVSLCIKCKVNKPCVVLRHKDVYCKDCFLAAVTHKFKSFLGKHRLVYPNDKVLINYKPGHESTTLLHMIRSGLDLTTPKKLKFQPVILYIENNYHLNIDQRREILAEINREAKEFDIPVFFTTLVAFLNKAEEEHINLSDNYEKVYLSNDDGKAINRLFTDKVSMTQRNEIYKILERKLLYKSAKQLQCKHVFTAEISSHVATQLMTSVCMGRGKYLSVDVGFCDDRNKDVNIIRPLRHFSSKEVAMYNHFHGLSSVNIPLNIRTTNSSIQGLLKTFVDTLQTIFAATVTTILKTGDKLTLDADIQKNDKCKLCEAPIDNPNAELTSAESTLFSKAVSNHKCTTSGDEEEDSLFGNIVAEFSAIQSKDYCFACMQLQRNAMLDDVV